MDNSNYIDDVYAVASNVVVMYSGKEKVIEIPENIGGHKIRRIGDGAFIKTDNMEAVLIKNGVEEIGESAFENNPTLKKLYIPHSMIKCEKNAFNYCDGLELIIVDRLLNKKQYDSLLNSSIKTVNNVNIVRSKATLPEGFADILIGLECVAKPILNINENHERIFIGNESIPGRVINSDKNLSYNHYIDKKLSAQLKYISILDSDEKLSEKETLSKKIKIGRNEPIYKREEEKNDLIIRMDTRKDFEKTMLISFVDSETIKIGEKYRVRFSLDIGYIFRQSAKLISAFGKKYYVYVRNVYTTDIECEYLKLEVGIYDENLNIVNDKEREAVYGKYKLLSVL